MHSLHFFLLIIFDAFHVFSHLTVCARYSYVYISLSLSFVNISSQKLSVREVAVLSIDILWPVDLKARCRLCSASMHFYAKRPISSRPILFHDTILQLKARNSVPTSSLFLSLIDLFSLNPVSRSDSLLKDEIFRSPVHF